MSRTQLDYPDSQLISFGAGIGNSRSSLGAEPVHARHQRCTINFNFEKTSALRVRCMLY